VLATQPQASVRFRPGPLVSPTTNQTGNALEATAERVLQRQGWRTYRVRRAPIRKGDGSWFMPKLDIGGADLLCWRPDSATMLAVQVTRDKGIATRVEDFNAAGWPPFVECQVWQDRSISGGVGVSRQQWAASRHFRIYSSKNGYALDKENLVWFDEQPTPPPPNQNRLPKELT
jgi:hypothetical protein